MNNSPSAKADHTAWPLAAYASLSPRLQSLYAFVQTLPVLGGLARKVVAISLPRGSRVWIQARAGLARGLWLNLDPRFDREFAQGFYEPAIQKILAEHLGEGGIFYDVGAHIGFISLIAARLVGESGAVFAFEADPENAGRIKQHVLRNGFAQISVFPLAVWSQSGTLRFQRSSELSGHKQGAVVGAGGEAPALEMIEVKALSLDEFVESHRTPTLIKIDVEGGEIEVLRGAERIFSKAMPTLICEVHNQGALEFTESYLAEKHYSVQWLSCGPEFPRHLLAEPRGRATEIVDAGV